MPASDAIFIPLENLQKYVHFNNTLGFSKNQNIAYHIISFIADHSFFMFCSDLVDPDRQQEMRPQTMDISAYSCPDVPHNYHDYAVPTCYSIDEMTNYRDIYEL